DTVPNERVQVSTEETAGNSASLVEIGNDVTNIRNSPSVEGEVIYYAEPGEQFEFVNNDGDWYQIKVDDETVGYVAGWVASIIEDSSEVDADESFTETADAQYARTASSLAEATIVIDAGHGGYDPGAISPDQTIHEKDITLDTALLLKNRLQDAGSNVILTRTADDFVSLNERVSTAHTHQADLFISLHYDSVE